MRGEDSFITRKSKSMCLHIYSTFSVCTKCYIDKNPVAFQLDARNMWSLNECKVLKLCDVPQCMYSAKHLGYRTSQFYCNVRYSGHGCFQTTCDLFEGDHRQRNVNSVIEFSARISCDVLTNMYLNKMKYTGEFSDRLA